MNCPRTHRLAVLPLAALAVVASAVPALAATSYATGCTVAPGGSSQSVHHETPLSHTGERTSVSVDPQSERLSASAGLSWNGVPTGDGCTVLASYRDAITVVGAGLPAGSSVDVTAVIGLVGDVTTSGSGTPLHVAEADATAEFTLRERFADFGTPELLYVRAVADAFDREVEGVPDDGSSFQHTVQVQGEEQDSSDLSDAVDGVRAFDIGTTTVTFSVPVGTVLDASATLTSGATVYDGAGEAGAVVDEFSVKLTTTTPGAALDRGDSPAPEPQPTALERVQAARAALASYGLPKGTANALGTKLEHAERDITAGTDACDDLSSFSRQVAAQRGKKLTAEQADALTALVSSARGLLGC